MKAPQKLGLDVVIDKHTGDLVTLEVNGFFSGYNGLKSLGRDLTFDIVKSIGKRFYGRRILINPQVYEFHGDLEHLIHFKTLKKDFKMDLVFSPYIPKKTTQQELEIICGPLNEYAALLGFGDCLEEVDYPQKMINSPAVELLTSNKLVQYELLRFIPNLNMPDSIMLDQEVNHQIIVQLLEKYEKVIEKNIHSSQGRDVYVLNYKDFVDHQTEEEISYLPLKIKTAAQMKMYFSRIHKVDPEVAESKLDWRMSKYGVLLQKFIETLPVVSEKTGKPHHARARLLWFGRYIGGYWGLSEETIDHPESYNLIVNYCNTKKAQSFTLEEEKIFRNYAHDLVPKILERAEQFENSVDEYQKITRDCFKEALFGNPRTF